MAGLSGRRGYYCTYHYNQIQSTLDKMESDVGASAYSKHTCAASGCSREGTRSITELSGYPEYYCTRHYKEMADIANYLFN